MSAVIYRNTNIVDGLGNSPYVADLVVQDGHISNIWRNGHVDESHQTADVQIVDAHDRWIMPGLWDSHVHYADWMPELFLTHGVTSVMDLNSHPWVLHQLELGRRGEIEAPRIHPSTQIIGGYLLPDTPCNPVKDPSHARDVAMSLLHGEATSVKVYTDLSPAELRAVIDVAHGSGLPVTGHLSSLDARTASSMGIGCLAHCSGVAVEAVAAASDRIALQAETRYGIAVDYPRYLMWHSRMDRDRAADLALELAANGTAIEADLINIAGRWISPGLDEWRAEDAALLDDRMLQYVPTAVRGRVGTRRALQELDADDRRRLAQGFDYLLEFLAAFYDAGGHLLAGSDSASFVLPGVSLHREMGLLARAGISPAEVIRAATSRPADYCSRSDLGRISEGAVADFVVLTANPIEDLRNVQAIDAVFIGGEPVRRGYTHDFQNPIPLTTGRPYLHHPPPVIAGVSVQASESAGASALTLRVDGSGILKSTTATVSGIRRAVQPDPRSFVPGTEYLPQYSRGYVVLPYSAVHSPNQSISLTNPAPEGGTSLPFQFYIYA